MTVNDAAAVTTTVNGTTYRFCSDRCRSMFLEEPDHFLRHEAARPTESNEPIPPFERARPR